MYYFCVQNNCTLTSADGAVCKSHPSSMCTHAPRVWNTADINSHKTQTTKLARATAPLSLSHHHIIMKQQRQPNSSSSRLSTVLLLSIALPYLLFSGCSAEESSSLLIDRHAGLKEKQLQRRLKKIDQKRIRQTNLSNLLEADATVAAASAGTKSSKAAAPGGEPRAAPPPTFPPTVSVQPSSKPSLSPTVSAQPSSKPSLSPSVSSQPSLAPSKSGKSSPRSRRYE
eukprot:scaffold8413_cov109-Skeletonema_dohrnii-CCMP3373.AAC.3